VENSGIVKTRDAPWSRVVTGVQHTGRGCRWGVVSTAGWISTTRGPILFLLFGGASQGLGLEGTRSNARMGEEGEGNTAPGFTRQHMFYYPIRQVEIVPLIIMSIEISVLVLKILMWWVSGSVKCFKARSCYINSQLKEELFSKKCEFCCEF
jgi:hypothetical protein